MPTDPSPKPLSNPADAAPETSHPVRPDHAANEPFFARERLSPCHRPGNAHQGKSLALAFLFSAMLHASLIALISFNLTYIPVRMSTSPPLSVTLAQYAPAANESFSKENPPPALIAQPPPELNANGPAQRPARFITDPDLSVLEEIPTRLPGAVTLRLYVTAIGTVERVSVLRSDPVPKELLDGLIERFGKAKLSPALIGTQATASTVDVTIRVDPPALPIDIGR